MARMARAVFAGVPHHITQRGNRKQQVFFSNKDYRLYKMFLAKYCKEFEVAIWAYCLMPNHIHLVAVPSNPDSLARAIGETHRRYTCEINNRYDWRGYLWQGRFSSFPMDDSHLYEAVRYIELNPVRAQLAETAEQWDWSSAKSHLFGRDDKLLQASPMQERVQNWHTYLSADSENLADLFRLHESTGRPLGSEKFIDDLELVAGRTLRPRKRGVKPGTNNRVAN